jgi:hypothetical protein
MLSGGWIPARPEWADARPLALGSTGTISGHAIAELRDVGGARLQGEDGIEECGGFGARRRSLPCPSPSSTTRQIPSARRARSAATNGRLPSALPWPCGRD